MTHHNNKAPLYCLLMSRTRLRYFAIYTLFLHVAALSSEDNTCTLL